MATRIFALILAISILAIVGVIIWATVRSADPKDQPTSDPSATAEVSQQFSDGRIEVRVFALGDRDVQVEIQFMADEDAIETVDTRPEVIFSMVDMQRHGFDSPLETVEAGVWRAKLKLPMAGRWIVSVGLGGEFAEVEFDAQ